MSPPCTLAPGCGPRVPAFHVFTPPSSSTPATEMDSPAGSKRSASDTPLAPPKKMASLAGAQAPTPTAHGAMSAQMLQKQNSSLNASLQNTRRELDDAEEGVQEKRRMLLAGPQPVLQLTDKSAGAPLGGPSERGQAGRSVCPKLCVSSPDLLVSRMPAAGERGAPRSCRCRARRRRLVVRRCARSETFPARSCRVRAGRRRRARDEKIIDHFAGHSGLCTPWPQSARPNVNVQ